MALNTSIFTQIPMDMPERPSWQRQEQDRLSLRNTGLQVKQNELALANQQKATREAEAFDAAFLEGGGDLTQIRAALVRRGLGAAVMQVDKAIADLSASERLAETRKFEAFIKQGEWKNQAEKQWMEYISAQLAQSKTKVETANLEAEGAQKKEKFEAEKATGFTTGEQLQYRQSGSKLPYFEWLKQEAAAKAQPSLVEQTSSKEPSMQERLAQLYTKRDTGKLAPAEAAELQGLENAMTLVARTYGPGFREVTSPEGQTSYFNPSRNLAVAAPEGTRPQYTAAEREELSIMDEMLGQLDMLEGLAKNNPGVIGFGQGAVADLRRKVTGGGGAEVNELFRISDNLADMLLRARSGAQINEAEYARLRAIVPNPRYSESKFFSDLAGFRAETRRVIERRTGQRPVTTPSGSTVEDALKALEGL